MNTSLPYDKIYDAVIFGAGYTGLGAALELSASGKDVLLVDYRASVAWESSFAYNAELAPGISRYADILRRKLENAEAAGPLRIDVPAAEIKLLEMLENVRILHYCHPAAVTMDNSLMYSVQLASKSGIVSVKAKMFVDATEQGQIMALAGFKNPLPQVTGHAFTFFLNKVTDVLSIPEEVKFGKRKILLKKSIWPGEVAVEFNAEGGLYRGRLEVPEILNFLRDNVPQLADAYLSHASVCELPLYDKVQEQPQFRTKLANFFNLSGPGFKTSFAERKDSLALRMKRGEDAATIIELALVEFKLPANLSLKDATPVSPSVTRNSNVLVCGGGTAGPVAALAAAQNGLKTELIEASTLLGGAGTGSSVHYYYHGVPGGLQDKIDEETRRLSTAFSGANKVNGFHPEAKKIVLQKLLEEAGVDIHFECIFTGCETENIKTELPAKNSEEAARKVKTVTVNSLNGSQRFKADTFIDSTGDADIAAMGGCRYSFGRDDDSAPHAYSQPVEVMSWRQSSDMLNFDAGYCDPTDPWDLSRARVFGLKHYNRPKFGVKDRILYTAPQIGLRNSRMIFGKYRITMADQIRCAEFDDVVGYTFSHYDNHALDYENESDEALIWVWGLGNWRTKTGSEIPYRCMIPSNITNVIVACRSISMDHDAHNQFRMMRDMQRLGEIAGLAAFVASQEKKDVADITVSKLQELLFKSGALKDKEHGYHWKGWRPDDLFAVQQKSIPGAGQPLALLAEYAEKSSKEELPTVPDSDNYRKTFAAALTGNSNAAGLLVKYLNDKVEAKTAGEMAVPVWQAAIAFIGMQKIDSALPELEKLLLDKNSDLRTLILSLKAINRIANKNSLKAVSAMLERDDLPCTETFRSCCDPKVIPNVKDNSRWKLELAAAKTLKTFGVIRKDLAEKYLNDERNIVRRAAAKFLKSLE